jgi:CRP-like cAMP-binding protein
MSNSNPTSRYREVAIAHTLESCLLLKGLPSDVVKEIVGFTVVKSVAKNEFLFHQGDDSQGFYVVQKGIICIHRMNAAGKEQVIHNFRPGESFAEGSLATSLGYPADARAMEATQVLLVKKDDFVAMIGKRPELAMRMLSSMAMHLRDLVGQIDDLMLKNVEGRLVMWLLKRCPDSESEEPASFELTITKRGLAAEIGTVSETLSRTMAKLREDGLIDVVGKNITVTCPAELSAVLSRQLGD